MPIERWSDTIWLVTPGEEPGLSDDLISAAEQAEQCVPVPSIVLDLGGVSHFNSTNVSQLLRLRRVIEDGSAKLRITAMAPPIHTVLKTMEIDRLFHCVEDVPTALAGLQLEA